MSDSSHNWVESSHRSWYCFDCGILKVVSEQIITYGQPLKVVYEYRRLVKQKVGFERQYTRYISTCSEEIVRVVLDE